MWYSVRVRAKAETAMTNYQGSAGDWRTWMHHITTKKRSLRRLSEEREGRAP
jgi:hypothetical protein